MRHRGPISATATIGCHLTRNRRRCPTQPTPDRPQRLTRSHPPGDLLTLHQRQTPRRPLRHNTRDRPPEPRKRNPPPHRRMSTPKPSSHRPHRLPSLQPIPHLRLLGLRQPPHHTPPQREHLSLALGDATTPRNRPRSMSGSEKGRRCSATGTRLVATSTSNVPEPTTETSTPPGEGHVLPCLAFQLLATWKRDVGRHLDCPSGPVAGCQHECRDIMWL